MRLFLFFFISLSLFALDYKEIILCDDYEHDKWDIQPKDCLKKFRAYTVSFDGADDSDNDGDREVNDKTGIPEWVAQEIRRTPRLSKSPKRPSTWIEDKQLQDVAP
ncbi:MAG: hypothetical protein HRT88_23990, partial [Lentisphaeraceae bacterium]|nr:hypothetical protein [Lentisphaeraceae bacterium]